MIIKKTNMKSSLTGATVKIENPRNVYSLYTNEFSGLSPAHLKKYFEAKRKGMNAFAGLLFDEITRRDLRIGSVLQTRKLAMANKEWLLTFDDDSKLPDSQKSEIIKFLKAQYEQIEIESFISQTNNAGIRGVQIFETVFMPNAGDVWLKEVAALPSHLYLYNDQTNEYKFVDHTKFDILQLSNESATASTLDRIDVDKYAIQNIEPFKFLEVHSLDGDAMNGFLNGCAESLTYAFMFKNYGLKDWAIYIERFAVPAVIGKYPPLMNDTDKAVLVKAVNNFGHLFNAIIPKDAEMNFSGDANKSGSTDMLKNYQMFWNDEISNRAIGQSGSTNNLKGGSYAAIMGLENVRLDITLGDLLTAARAVNKLNKKLQALNPVLLAELPAFNFKKLIDMEALLKQSQMLVNIFNAGYEADGDDIYREFGFKVTKKPEPTAPGSAIGFTGAKKFTDIYTGDTWLENWLKQNEINLI